MLSYLLLSFSVVVAIQCIYYLLYATIIFEKKSSKEKASTPISIVICAKNEAENLVQFLPSILKQTYEAPFEIVLINDRSTDNTLEVMHNFALHNSHIKIVNVENCENFWGNKKYALTLGIKAATYEHLILTDADCKANSNRWLQTISSQFTNQTKVILGYGAYQKVKFSLLNKLIRYETLLTAIQYFSYAKLGTPYMGVGRNLAYTKSDFFKVNGFIKHIDIKSGDDDLFINEIASKKNTTYTLAPASYTTSVPKRTWSSWILQKRRHISTAKHYKLHHKIGLGLFYSSQLLFFVLGSLLLILEEQLQPVYLLIAIRYFVFMLAIGLTSQKLNEKDLIVSAPFTEITLIFIQLFVFIKNKFSTPTHW